MSRSAFRANALAALAAAAFASILSSTGCGSNGDENGDNFGNLLASPGGLEVLREEHPSGWGRADCFACHEIRNMHVVNRTDLPDCDALPPGSADPCIDLAEIQSIIANQGEDSCMLCHGTNGAEP
jgi:hypothetical protein